MTPFYIFIEELIHDVIDADYFLSFTEKEAKKQIFKYHKLCKCVICILFDQIFVRFNKFHIKSLR